MVLSNDVLELLLRAIGEREHFKKRSLPLTVSE